MRTRILGSLIIVSLAAAFLPGCSKNEKDKAHARLNLEEQAQRDAEQGNKAITDLNKRMFGKKTVAPARKK